MIRYIMAWLLLLVTFAALIFGSHWYLIQRPEQAYAYAQNARKAEQAESRAMSAYQWAFANEVHTFAMKNRIDQGFLHPDKHANCYLRVVMNAAISGDGGLESVSVEKSSGVPIVDKYYTYAIELAAPYQPLSSQFSDGRQRVSIVYEFTLDARLYDDSQRSKHPCDELGQKVSNYSELLRHANTSRT